MHDQFQFYIVWYIFGGSVGFKCSWSIVLSSVFIEFVFDLSEASIWKSPTITYEPHLLICRFIACTCICCSRVCLVHELCLYRMTTCNALLAKIDFVLEVEDDMVIRDLSFYTQSFDIHLISLQHCAEQ